MIMIIMIIIIIIIIIIIKVRIYHKKSFTSCLYNLLVEFTYISL